MTSLAGKVALITGSGSGIGRAAALHLAECGAAVMVHDINADGAGETARQIAERGGEASVWVADVSDVAAMRKVVAEGEAKHGHIDVLVNNAGIVSEFRPLEEVTEGMFDHAIAVHVRGTVFTTQAVIPGMKRRRCGKIINISSIQGLVGAPNGAAYNAAKGAILAMTKGWAKEFAPWNITANVLAPGPILTPMVLNRLPPDYFPERAKQIPLGRWGTAEEMARFLGFLCSPDADFMTGQVVSPNGGIVIT